MSNTFIDFIAVLSVLGVDGVVVIVVGGAAVLSMLPQGYFAYLSTVPPWSQLKISETKTYLLRNLISACNSSTSTS